jgi:hypothetical protein
MENRTRSIFRLILSALVLAYGLTLILWFYGPERSTPAEQYEQIVDQTMSGLSLWYGLQKLVLIVANGLGAFGIAALFVLARRGLWLVVFSGPLLALAAILGAPPVAFPRTQSISTFLLWCVTSATWACVCTYGLVRRQELFDASRPG